MLDKAAVEEGTAETGLEGCFIQSSSCAQSRLTISCACAAAGQGEPQGGPGCERAQGRRRPRVGQGALLCCASVSPGCACLSRAAIVCLRCVGEEHAWLWKGLMLSRSECALRRAGLQGGRERQGQRAQRARRHRARRREERRQGASGSTCMDAERVCMLCSSVGSTVPALPVAIMDVGVLCSALLLPHGTVLSHLDFEWL